MLTKRKRGAKTAPASINSFGVLFINTGTSFRVGAFFLLVFRFPTHGFEFDI